MISRGRNLEVLLAFQLSPKSQLACIYSEDYRRRRIPHHRFICKPILTQSLTICLNFCMSSSTSGVAMNGWVIDLIEGGTNLFSNKLL
jgi:hypothetical protein